MNKIAQNIIAKFLENVMKIVKNSSRKIVKILQILKQKCLKVQNINKIASNVSKKFLKMIQKNCVKFEKNRRISMKIVYM